MSQDGTRLGRISFSNKLPGNLVFAPGAVINRYPNKQREDKNDADISLSIQLPTEDADKLILAMGGTVA